MTANRDTLTTAYPKTVKLKDHRSVVIRPLAQDDFDRLHASFLALPEEDRIFLRHDVRDPELVREWTRNLDFERCIPLMALDGNEIVGNGRLYMMTHGWMQHVGLIRLITAGTHRHAGLGALILRELVALAEERNLEKLQAQVIEDSVAAIKLCQAVGFETAAILKDMVKDQTGRKRNLAIMVSDVANLSRIMEDWIHDSMQPAYRVPGAGC